MDTSNTAETWLAHAERWHAQHQELVDAWVEQMGGPTPWEPGFDLHRFAARALVGVPEARAVGWAPGEPERESYVWDEIDAYEVLFIHVVHGGHPGDVDSSQYLKLLGSFATFLGEQGVIGRDEHVALQRDWAVWSQRLLEVWEHGGWYFADGIYRAPERNEERYREDAPAKVRTGGSRFGRHRRRTRPARR
ncbi:MAG: hypothetical protein KUG77_07230 [Nannocystaceae bacterium]|nr:hypothetical protein [Nannocystaceae bacterium]